MKRMVCTGIVMLLFLTGVVASAAEVGGKYVFGSTKATVDLGGSIIEGESDTGEYLLYLGTPLAGKFGLDLTLGFRTDEGFTVATDGSEWPETIEGSADSVYVGANLALTQNISLTAGYSNYSSSVDFYSVGMQATGLRFGAGLDFPVNDKLAFKASAGFCHDLSIDNSLIIELPDDISQQAGNGSDLDLGITYAINPEVLLTVGYRCSKLEETINNLELGEGYPEVTLKNSGLYVGLSHLF